jgi:hypothetical protein
MSSLLLADPPSVSTHHPLGASTGYMSDQRGDWPSQIRQASQLSPFAIELSVLSEAEMGGLASYLETDPPIPFRYVSIHGPSKGRVMSEPDLANALVGLSTMAQAIVMHPDTIEDPGNFRVLGRKLVLENMDRRKRDGRTAEELDRLFAELPEAGFCFDVAHAWSVDYTMIVGTELLDAFRTRLRHIHVSSMSQDLHHVSLTEEHEELFMPLLQRCLDVPWILEAPPRRS